MKLSKYRGSLTRSLFENKTIQDYLEECHGTVWGYLGHENRSDDSDVFIQYHAKDLGFSEAELARFLISRTARHFMDVYPELNQSKDFRGFLKNRINVTLNNNCNCEYPRPTREGMPYHYADCPIRKKRNKKKMVRQ